MSSDVMKESFMTSPPGRGAAVHRPSRLWTTWVGPAADGRFSSVAADTLETGGAPAGGCQDSWCSARTGTTATARAGKIAATQNASA